MKHSVITGAVVSAAAATMLVGAGAGGARTDVNRTLQAWLAGGGAAQAAAGRGVFVATLRGRTLSWSLAYRRGGARATAAHLHLSRAGGPVAATLCAPCKTTARGRVVLGSSAANAVQAGRAYVDVHVRPGTAIRGRIVSETMPTLAIVSPKSGATLTLPAQITYQVTGVDIANRRPHLEVSTADTDARSVDLALDEDGTVTLPDVKDAAFTGQRDLVFQLATSDGVPLPNVEAKVVVRRLTIHGHRTGP
jgi:hypothetical protein